VLDLMGQASVSTPGPEPPPPPRGGEDLMERVERLTGELEQLPDSDARAVAEELVAAVLEFHGDGLARLLSTMDVDQARAMVEEDEVVASLLLIHDLYPVALEERVVEALDSVRPYMESHGGDVDFLGVEDGVAHLRLQGSCSGCAASSATLELAIKKALSETAPDLVGLEVEGIDAQPTHGPPDIGGTPLPLAGQAGNGGVPALSGWQDLDAVASLPGGQMAAQAAGPVDLLVANVNGTLLAYRNACATCESPLHEGSLAGGILTCPSCSARFDLPRAGRGSEDAAVQLDPVPLLRDGPARVRVAVPA
jgi:Fe-S cluster biogenesis protein NfuA/nitrite reductase/ring-hydroxylating ferredoxin subunit